MGHVGVICPNAPGHLNPMVALADATRARGQRVTSFLLGAPPPSVPSARFEIVPLGGSVFPHNQYRAGLQQLGSLQGRAALKHTFAMGARAAEAILEVGPTTARAAGVTALLIDQASFPGGTVADQLGIPFATVCNALLLHPDSAAPPFFTHWQPRDTGWARIRNRIAWAGLNRLYAPILTRIQDHRRRLGLPVLARMAAAWSNRLQVSQQPEAFEFPRRELWKHVQFVGPLRLPGGYQPVPFPWERLDGRPLIYTSLGTLQNRVAKTFRVIAEAGNGLDAQLVISTWPRRRSVNSQATPSWFPMPPSWTCSAGPPSQ
jgi:zeaxanthin glucosyltransferase